MADEELPPHYPERVGALKMRPIGEIDWLARLIFRREMQKICESPIEIEFAVAFEWLARGRFIAEPQFKLGIYRYDFLIRSISGKAIMLVECDGKEFHSTPEQILNDICKNKVGRENGLHVFRLSGATINRSPNSAAQSVIDFCLENYKK
jgi:very-short-patch-repair endonuclease